MNEVYNDKVREFDAFYSTNYKYLLGFSKSINPQADYESLTHDVFIRCRNRIEAYGYSGDTFLNFVRVSLMNTYKSNYRQQKKYQLIDIEDPDYWGLTEEVLEMKAGQDLQQEEQNNINTYLTSNVYEYLDKYCSPKELFVFRCYYLLKHHHINYKELSRITGYSITSVSNIIKRLKKQLRRSLELYIRTGMNMEELLKEVESAINNGASWENWKALHLKIFGTNYNGCKCKQNKIENLIREWYEKNK